VAGLLKVTARALENVAVEMIVGMEVKLVARE
jgi:hypothetical protein